VQSLTTTSPRAVGNEAPGGGRAPATGQPSARQASVTSAFEVLLSACWGTAPDRLAAMLDASAEQMFEAPPGSAEQSAQARREDAAPAEGDMTSKRVEALRAHRAAGEPTQAGGESVVTGAVGVASGGGAADGARSTSGDDAGATDARTVGRAFDGLSDRAWQEVAARSTGSGASGGRGQTTSQAPAPGSGAPPVLTATVLTDAVANAGQAGSQSVARQVAELLNSGRAGEATSVRSVPATAADARTAATMRAAAPSATGSKQSGATAARTPVPDETRSPLFERLVRTMKLQGGWRSSSARMQLYPPELGRMRVDVQLSGKDLSVAVRVERAEAQELLSERLGSLKTALEQHGVHVKHLEVTVASGAGAGESAAERGSAGGGESPAGTPQQSSADLPGETAEGRDSSPGRTASLEEAGAEDGPAAVAAGGAVEAGEAVWRVGTEARLDIRV